MARDSKGNGGAQKANKSSVFDPIATLQDFMSKMDGVSPSGANPMAGWLEMNQHWMTFLSNRFKQDADLLHRLGACKDPTEATSTFSDFYKAAVDDYQREFAEMASLGQKAIDQAAGAYKGDAKSKPGGKT
ncbi:hypothetical protein PEL8287_01460 [Roseovarius litorisediminis]|uniref:Phasin domain-containing protein n=1 Tax=Roseovarius litorisediminis TaxID=1312363 RepID=A0A1Y5S2Q2_9RHOB|nr:phasin family protein [Roseovarius litorisediminis]SLN31252.1 hypothetical protein PEL8287_01460 [Roseovarius litorisediminis]